MAGRYAKKGMIDMKIKELEAELKGKGYIIKRRYPQYCGRTRSQFPTNWVLIQGETEIDEDYSKKKLIERNIDYLLSVTI